MAPIPLSVLVVTKNEETNIAGCLASLVSHFGQVVVLDSESTDRTLALAQEAGAQIQSFHWNGRYPRKRQWAFDNIAFSYDWIFQVDADERVTPELITELAELFAAGPRHKAYTIRLDYFFLGQRLRHGQQIQKVVLVHRRFARYAPRDDDGLMALGDVEGHIQPVIDGSLGHLRAKIIHHDHRSLYDYFTRHNGYSDWEVRMRASGQRTGAESLSLGRRWAKGVFHSLGPIQPLAVFFYSYLWRLGFLDGAAGFHFAIARAFYYWQVQVKWREWRQQSATDRRQ